MELQNYEEGYRNYLKHFKVRIDKEVRKHKEEKRLYQIANLANLKKEEIIFVKNGVKFELFDKVLIPVKSNDVNYKLTWSERLHSFTGYFYGVICKVEEDTLEVYIPVIWQEFEGLYPIAKEEDFSLYKKG